MGQAGKQRDRRAFLGDLVRYPLLAGLGLLGGHLAARQGGPVQAGQSCVNRGICRGCGRLGACGLPQASMTRDVLARGRRLPTPGGS
ncbi:MAG TPA: hypothetical protein VM431_12410 [Phycisphaerae bacterium]|nr:hypothetical protein [Phycisphaerae bacterium]